MANIVKFGAVKLKALGKKGILKPDENGYYELVVGGLNVFNSAGQYYTLESAKKLFESNSVLMRRIADGQLRGELGHPRKLPGMTMQDYIRRLIDIDETNIVCHFKEIWLDYDYAKNIPGVDPNTVAIMAKVKPSGAKGYALKEALENPDENVAFSIRAFSKDKVENGIVVRELVNIVTWDYVNEPGISIANKWDSPATESDFNIVTDNMLEEMLRDESMVANESSIDIIKTTLDAIKVPTAIDNRIDKW